MENSDCMFALYSPNMLKTFQQCERKFFFKYVKKISMPVNDAIFEFGKNIHALASYYLKKENIDKMEYSLNAKEREVWEALKGIKYFSYEFVESEYNLSVKIGNYIFGGRIDAIVKNNDEYFILDYKTGAVPKNPKFDYQTMIYIMAVKEFFKSERVNFVYIDLKNKDEVKIKYTDELGNDYKSRLIKVVEKINSNELSEKKADCSCEYSSICF